MQRTYMDHAATTPVDKRVVAAMSPFFTKKYGNPSSLHSFGQEAREAVEESRETVRDFINAGDGRIAFTSGGTESDNLALKGIAFANRERGKHIITTPIEHHCVLHSAEWLAKNGFEVTYLPVDKHGLVNPADVEKAIRKDTILVSVMHANNEIGTIEPLEEIGKVCSERGVYFHTDAVQTYGKIPIDVDKLHVDALAASSHKLYGPKGVGMLYLRKNVKIEPTAHGGGQEGGLRSSTENVPGIVGFGKATALAKKEMEPEAERQKKLRDTLIKGVLQIGDSHLNGHPEKRLPNNANFWFAYVEGESLVLQLDVKGIAASTGSACSSQSLEPSHVLLAIGLKPEQAHGSLRLTLGKQNTQEHVDRVLEELPPIVGKLREISPFKKGFKW